MPCDSSHMAPTEHEEESIRVAKLIVLAFGYLNKDVPEWISKAAANCYGDTKRIHQLTAMLCATCKSLHDDILYNGHDREARKLATWWDDHKEADRIREVREKEKIEAKQAKIKKAGLRKQALAKLTPEEREAIK